MTLDRFAALLRRRAVTARQASETLGCSIPIVYQWVQALRDRGENVVEVSPIWAKPGPKPTAYRIR